MDYSAALKDYSSFEFSDGRWTRTVFRRGSGPGVIIIHEMPGLHPLVVRFGDHVAAAGMTAFLPSLFGTPGRPVATGYAMGEISPCGQGAAPARLSIGCAPWHARCTPPAAGVA